MSKVVSMYAEREPLPPLSDTKLVAATAVGDMAALGALFRRYHGDVHTFLARLSGTDNAEIDDLVQNTFLQVRKSAGRFQHRSSVRSWIFAIAANVARHHARASVRQRTAVRALACERGAPVDPGGSHEHVEQKALRTELTAAVGRLSYKLRVVLIMCDVEGIPGREAAKSLGIKEGTLWRRLHDARKRLARELEGRVSI